MENLTFGFLTGLSVGVYCLGLCLPVFLPILFSQKRSGKKSFYLVLQFSAGRLIGYFLFGLTFGYLGQKIQSQLIHTIISLVNLWMGITLILFGLGQIDKKFCSLKIFQKIKWPLLLGFLTGVNVCPPLMASLTHVFSLRSAINSLFYFLAFFVGTSIYLIPATLFGVFTKFPLIQKMGRLAGIIAGFYFVARNLLIIF
ncbi:sulfite exporter TauE/SafE family protein [Candidatus Shapirobacteria bacterium]|nr:sulfite exporter TauE/SafE family protein [Candidatus Shapirobacteria bacterium]